jgi:hypothetical protein
MGGQQQVAFKMSRSASERRARKKFAKQVQEGKKKMPE